MAFSKIRVILNGKFVLEHDVRNLDYAQAMYRAREINRMCKLDLRKVGATPVFARRLMHKSGSRYWSYKTRIELI